MYTFLRKAILSDRTVIGGKVFNKGEVVYEISETNIFDCTIIQVVYMTRDEVKDLLTRNEHMINGLRLDSIGRIIVKK